eukprot:487177-Rhodomonas_salina.2
MAPSLLHHDMCGTDNAQKMIAGPLSSAVTAMTVLSYRAGRLLPVAIYRGCAAVYGGCAAVLGVEMLRLPTFGFRGAALPKTASIYNTQHGTNTEEVQVLTSDQ